MIRAMCSWRQRVPRRVPNDPLLRLAASRVAYRRARGDAQFRSTRLARQGQAPGPSCQAPVGNRTGYCLRAHRSSSCGSARRGSVLHGFALPLTDRAHNRKDQPSGGRAGVQRPGNRNQHDLPFLQQFEQAAEILHAAVSLSSFATMTVSTFLALTSETSRCSPGRLRLLADSQPSTITSIDSAPWTVAMARTLASRASRETPWSACRSVDTLT